jgi:predicted AAA+ superfamily ATPase
VKEFERLVVRAERLIEKLEGRVALQPLPIDWKASSAFRWRKYGMHGWFEPIKHPHAIRLQDLHAIESQKKTVEENTRQFARGYFANNIMLTGARGTGKSSLVKAVVNRYARSGLRMVEVQKDDLMDLAAITDQLYDRPERFILFCDDLSFTAHEAGYKALKAALDGSMAATPRNVLVYATSNRRHFMPEYIQENLETTYPGGEVHPGEAVEEKVSLAERFGLWVSFHPFRQEEYLYIVDYWLDAMHVSQNARKNARLAALQWAMSRGSRSGRVAWQFARNWAGQHGVPAGP